MLRKIFALIAVSAVLLVTLACSISVPSNVSVSLKSVKGSGNVETETRPVSGFSSVVLSGMGDLHIEQGNEEGLRIEAEDNLLPLIETEVRGDTLEIRVRNNTNISPTEPIDYYLQVKSLEEIQINGMGLAEAKSLEADKLRIKISGMGDVEIDDLECPDVRIEISGSGSVSLSGTGDRLEVMIPGLGNVKVNDFTTQTADVTISGSGDAFVNAAEKLVIQINGSGSVEYSGSPQLSERITGSGTIRQK